MPRIVEQTEERLVIRGSDPLLSGLLLLLAVGCTGLALVLYLRGSPAVGTERFWGLVSGAFLFSVGFLALFEQTTFVFDRPTRRLHWQRRRAWGQHSSTVGWNEIRAVVVQASSSVSAGQIRSWRVALRLSKGELPLSVSYAPDPDKSLRTLAQGIARFLGVPADLADGEE